MAMTYTQIYEVTIPIDGEPVRVRVDYEDHSVSIMIYGDYNKSFPLSDYNGFDGDLQDYVKSKLAERNTDVSNNK